MTLSEEIWVPRGGIRSSLRPCREAQVAPVTTFAFDNPGRQIEKLNPLNNLTATGYENLGRRIITTAADPDGTGSQSALQNTRDYDAAGNLVAVTDALGRVTAYHYDQLHRLVKVTLPDPDGPRPASGAGAVVHV